MIQLLDLASSSNSSSETCSISMPPSRSSSARLSTTAAGRGEKAFGESMTGNAGDGLTLNSNSTAGLQGSGSLSTVSSALTLLGS